MHRFLNSNNHQFMNKLLCAIIALTFVYVSCDKNETMSRDFTYTFSNGAEGWNSFFSDYPQGSEELFELTFGHTMLPDSSAPAIMISGINHSDDLLSFIYRKFDGLQPGKTYSVTFDVDLVSNVPSNSIGIGGSPDLAFGVGGVSYEPANTTDGDGWYR